MHAQPRDAGSLPKLMLPANSRRRLAAPGAAPAGGGSHRGPRADRVQRARQGQARQVAGSKLTTMSAFPSGSRVATHRLLG